VGYRCFVFAGSGHFVTEAFVFKTSSLKDAAIPFVIASASIVLFNQIMQ
jgi:hypothetical protein